MEQEIAHDFCAMSRFRPTELWSADLEKVAVLGQRVQRVQTSDRLDVCLGRDVLQALFCLDSQLAPRGKDGWHRAEVEPVHETSRETH